jgi:hypothetical protein
MGSLSLIAAATGAAIPYQITVAQMAAGAAIFGALAGFAGSIANIFANRWLEQLRFDLTSRQSERKAKLDYEYEARKKLYERCEPAAFRFIRECELSRNRILLLHTLSASDELAKWLELEENRVSTVYRLFAPVATYYQINGLLTSYDLTLAPRLHAIFALGRLLRDSFVSDKQLAGSASGQALEYEPDHDGGSVQAVHQRQGLTYEELDILVTAMTGDGGIIQLPAFVKAYNDVDNPVRKAANGVDHIVRDLDPDMLPVLWRIYFYNLSVTTLLCNLMHRQPTSVDFAAHRIFEHAEGAAGEWAQGSGAPVLHALDAQLARVAAELRSNTFKRRGHGSRR